jgi:SlyX protein
MSEARLIEIEKKLAFQEHTIHELSEALFQHEKELAALKEAYKLLLDRFKTLSDHEAPRDPRTERPPHY